MTALSAALRFLAPEFVLLLGGVVLLCASIFPGVRERDDELALSTLLLLALSAFLLYFQAIAPFNTGVLDRGVLSFLGTDHVLFRDKFAVLFKAIFLGTAAPAVLVLWLAPGRRPPAESWGLLILATLLGMVVAGAADLILLVVGLEALGIVALVPGLRRSDKEETRSALAGFVLAGGLATGALVLGAALLIAFTGETNLLMIQHRLTGRALAGIPAPTLALVLLIAGISFKFPAAPFHGGSIRLTEHAGVPGALLLHGLLKVAALAAAARLFVLSLSQDISVTGLSPRLSGVAPLLPAGGVDWITPMLLIAALSVVGAQIACLRAQTTGALLAWASILQSGCLLLGLAALADAGYLAALAHLLPTLLALFGALVILAPGGLGARVDTDAGLRGLAVRSPLSAWSLTAFSLSLGGIIPLAGGISQWKILVALLEQAHRSHERVELWIPAVLLVLSWGLALAWGARVVRLMWSPPESGQHPAPTASRKALVRLFLTLLLASTFCYPILAKTGAWTLFYAR